MTGLARDLRIPILFTRIVWNNVQAMRCTCIYLIAYSTKLCYLLIEKVTGLPRVGCPLI